MEPNPAISSDISFDLSFITKVWMEGGWVMIPLACLTAYIYYQGAALYFHLIKAGVKKIPVDTWSKWIADPGRGIGHMGDVIQYVVFNGYSYDEITRRIEELKQRFLSDINPKLLVLSVLVTVAPLMGLLGTVIGMLTTFKGLASSSGQTIDMVANGVSVALITTQTGLIIAIPGYLLIYSILKRRNEYIVFLSQVENLAIQQGGKQEAA